MKPASLYLSLFALAGFLYLSDRDYEAEKEAARVERQLYRQAKLEQAADSLGLTGQDWINFVNREED